MDVRSEGPDAVAQGLSRGLRVTWQGVAVNVGLLVLKFVAGIWGNSQAMLADAVHTFSDLATDVAVLAGIRYARKPRDEDHAYGHGKYETVAAALVGLLLFGAGVQIGWHALQTVVRATQGQPPGRPAAAAFGVALFSVAVKEALFRRTRAVGRATGSAAILANAWHHRSDALSSVGTTLGIGAAAFLGPAWAILDPLAALLVSGLLLKVAWDIVRAQIGSLTEQSLSRAACHEIEALARGFPALSYPHNLRTRTVGRTVVIDLHVRVDPAMRVVDAHAVVSALEAQLRQRFGEDTIANVHVEPL